MGTASGSRRASIVSQVGYQRSEFFVGGNARSYSPAAPLTSDGKWNVTTDPGDHAGIFKTRLVVYRPIDPARFNGTVVVEWLNVTAGADLPTDWVMAHNELVRSGAVWVGVSAQAVGVNRAKADDPVRYASLVHPGDSFSYDIFTTSVRDIRQQYATVLGGLQPQRMIAAGESQSAGRLVTYINAVQPTEHVYDGFLVHSRSGGGSSLSQSPQPVGAGSVAAADPRRPRRARVRRRGRRRTFPGYYRGAPAGLADVPAVGDRRYVARRRVHRDASAVPTSATVPVRSRCSSSCAIHRCSDARTA